MLCHARIDGDAVEKLSTVPQKHDHWPPMTKVLFHMVV